MDTHQLGKAVPGSFSTKIQRRLASTVPPRPIVEVDFREALEKLKQLCLDCEEATGFTDLRIDPLEYQSFLWNFASRQPAPLPYSRSYLANILFHPDTLNTAVSLPLEDVKAFVFHASTVVDPFNWTLSPPRNPLIPKPPKVQFALIIDEFVERVGQPYLDLWVALGQNKCRLRRMLPHVIMAWDILQSDAMLVDDELMAAGEQLGISSEILDNPLSSWVYIKKLWMIEKVVLLGFEQDIYLPDEFAGMYHFLSSVASKRVDALQRCDTHVRDRIIQLVDSGHVLDAQDVDESALFVESSLQQAKGISTFANALHGIYTILNYTKLIPRPNRPFSTEELRYELRMKPFLSLQSPEVPLFSSFQNTVQPYGPYDAATAELFKHLKDHDSILWTKIDMSLKEAKDAFAKVKKSGAVKARAGGVEQAWNKEIQGILASCVALGVAVAGVKSAVQHIEAGGENVAIRVEIPGPGAEKRYSEGWVIPKLEKL